MQQAQTPTDAGSATLSVSFAKSLLWVTIACYLCACCAVAANLLRFADDHTGWGESFALMGFGACMLVFVVFALVPMVLMGAQSMLIVVAGAILPRYRKRWIRYVLACVPLLAVLTLAVGSALARAGLFDGAAHASLMQRYLLVLGVQFAVVAFSLSQFVLDRAKAKRVLAALILLAAFSGAALGWSSETGWMPRLTGDAMS